MNKFIVLAFDQFLNKPFVLLASLLIALVILPKDVRAMDVECEMPLGITCEVSDPSGFMAVRVNVDFGDLGQIDVVNHTFSTCRTSATVSWDPIVDNFQVFTTECESDIKFDAQGRKIMGSSDRVRYFEIEVDEFRKTKTVKSIKPKLKLLNSTDPLRAHLESFKAQNRPISPEAQDLLSLSGNHVLTDTSITCSSSTNICTCTSSSNGDCGAKLGALCGDVTSWGDAGVGENCPEVDGA